VSPSPPPLRTARASFPAGRSSRLTGRDALSVSWTMTSSVEPWEVLAFITSPGLYREEVREVDLLSIEQGWSTPRTLPTLGFGYCIEPAAFGHALTTHLPAPALPIRFQGRIIRARAAFDLHMAANGEGRPPVESEAAGLATSLPTVRVARGAVLPDCEVSAVDPPLGFLGMPAFRPAPQRSPAVVVSFLEGLFTDRLALVHGPTSDERVQVATHGFWRDGLVRLQP
jgi:hypothetical protein